MDTYYTHVVKHVDTFKQIQLKIDVHPCSHGYMYTHAVLFPRTNDRNSTKRDTKHLLVKEIKVNSNKESNPLLKGDNSDTYSENMLTAFQTLRQNHFAN